MESLVFWPPTGIGAARLVLLALPLAVTSLNIGVQEWRRRNRKANTEDHLAVSLAEALDSGVLEFRSQPRNPCINVFAHVDEEPEDMQLVLSPRSLVRSKPWLSDSLVAPEPASRIVKVYMLGPAADPPSTMEPMQDESFLLPAAPPQPPPITGRLAEFFGVRPAAADPIAPMSCTPPMTRKAERHCQMISWKNHKEALPEMGRIAPPVFPSIGLQAERIQASPAIPGYRMEQPGFVAAAAIAEAVWAPSSPVKKDLPLGNFAGFSAQPSGAAEPVSEPFQITPPMRLPRTWFDRDAWPKRRRKCAVARSSGTGSDGARVVYLDFRASKPVPRSAQNLKWGR